MSNFSKWMVVPYVKPIERPADSKVQELDKQMSMILSNPKLSIYEKVQMYSQSLSKFQSHFNPDSYGESPTMMNLSNTVDLLAENMDKMAKEKAEVDKSKLKKSDEIVNNIASLSENLKKDDKDNLLIEIEQIKQNIDEIKNSLVLRSEPKVNIDERVMEGDRTMYQSFNAPVTPTVFETPTAPRGQSYNPNTIKFDDVPASPVKVKRQKRTELDRLDPLKTNIINQAGQGMWLTKDFF
jgi:hypothetical protein